MKQVQNIFYRVVCTVNHLHSADIVHRNLSLNSFHVAADSSRPISEYSQMKLVDLSSARSLRPPYPPVLKSPDLSYSSQKWSEAYRPQFRVGRLQQPELDPLPDKLYHMVRWSPELILLQCDAVIDSPLQNHFDWKKCDIWALGIMLVELLRYSARLKFVCSSISFLNIRMGEPLLQGKGGSSSSLYGEILSIADCRPADLKALQGSPPLPLTWICLCDFFF